MTRAAGATLEAIRSDLVKVLRERRKELDRRQAGELWGAVKTLKPEAPADRSGRGSLLGVGIRGAAVRGEPKDGRALRESGAGAG